jgi:hypothetical protein
MSGDATDGEEFTNKIPSMLAASTPTDRQSSGVDLAFATHLAAHLKCARLAHFKRVQAADPGESRPLWQGLVNHADQGLVNHAGKSGAGDGRLTRLIKPKRPSLWQGLAYRPGT